MAGKKRKGKVALEKRNVVLKRLEVTYMAVGDLKPNSYNPNRQSEHDFELLLRSIEDDGFCVESSTPVLCADLVWRPAGELHVGQEVVAFDDEEVAGRGQNKRRLRTAQVTSNSLFEDELYEVRTEGDVVRCNAEHPWLARRQLGPIGERFYGAWVKTADLRPGDEVVKLFDVWPTERTFEAGWLSGFLDGEGCVSAEAPNNGSEVSVARLSVTQKPGATADRMVSEMQRRVEVELATVKWSETHPERNWQDNVRVRVSSMADVMKILGSVRPARLLENAGRFWEGRSFGRGGGRYRAVVSIDKVGMGELAALSTTTKTYVANGFAVHNTQPIVVHGPSKTIIDGEHRWRACKALGYDEVPVVMTDMTPEQMRIATLRHNRARGSEDAGLASEVLRELISLGTMRWAQDALMLDDVELRRLTETMRSEDVHDLVQGDVSDELLGARGAGLSDFDKEHGVDTAADQTRAKEQIVAGIRADEEAAMIAQDRSNYRLVLFFAGDEATLVSEVLGKDPPTTVLEMCRAAEAKAV